MSSIRLERWQNQVTSAYLHIPFCIQKCGYCDFHSFTSSPLNRAAYVEALIREIHLEAKHRPADRKLALKTVYLGGGTPGLLEDAQLAQILEAIDQTFGLAQQAEITLETNPGIGHPERAKAWKKMGFNRLSMGLQAIQSHHLKRLGRIHRLEDFDRLTQAAQAAGFERLNADLMIGLPYQTLAEVDESLAYLLARGYQHVSVYSLILEPGTPFEKQYGSQAGRAALPDEILERAQMHQVTQRLEAAGRMGYELSNFASPGHESQHNLVYWEALPYYGWGCGAHRYVDGVRRGSLKDFKAYLQAFDGSSTHTAKAEIQAALYPFEEAIDEAEARREFFLLGLRKLKGVTRQAFADRFGEPINPSELNTLQSLVDCGLLAKQQAGWCLTLKGRDLANQVFAAFLA